MANVALVNFRLPPPRTSWSVHDYELAFTLWLARLREQIRQGGTVAEVCPLWEFTRRLEQEVVRLEHEAGALANRVMEE